MDVRLQYSSAILDPPFWILNIQFTRKIQISFIENSKITSLISIASLLVIIAILMKPLWFFRFRNQQSRKYSVLEFEINFLINSNNYPPSWKYFIIRRKFRDHQLLNWFDISIVSRCVNFISFQPLETVCSFSILYDMWY